MRDFEAVHEERRLEPSSLLSKTKSLRRKNCEEPTFYLGASLSGLKEWMIPRAANRVPELLIFKYRMDQNGGEMDTSQMEQEHQAAVELWNDLQSQSDNVCTTRTQQPLILYLTTSV
jgi:hypothetical protein